MNTTLNPNIKFINGNNWESEGFNPLFQFKNEPNPLESCIKSKYSMSSKSCDDIRKIINYINNNEAIIVRLETWFVSTQKKHIKEVKSTGRNAGRNNNSDEEFFNEIKDLNVDCIINKKLAKVIKYLLFGTTYLGKPTILQLNNNHNEAVNLINNEKIDDKIKKMIKEKIHQFEEALSEWEKIEKQESELTLKKQQLVQKIEKVS